MSLDKIFDELLTLEDEKINLFLNTVEGRDFTESQMEQIYLCVKDGNDLSVIDNELMTSYEMEVARLLMKKKHDSECIKNLFTYDEDLVKRVLTFYNMGHRIVDFILIEKCDWFVEFLIHCVMRKINLEILRNKGLEYDQVYWLANCICLGYDVNGLLEAYKDDLESINKRAILEYFIGSCKKNKVYLVSRIEALYEDDVNESCTVMAPSSKDARLIASLKCYMDSFNTKTKEFDPNSCEYGVIQIKTIYD